MSEAGGERLAASATARRRWLRLGFFALLGGGLVLLAQRRPRDCPIEIDLSPARPEEIASLDLQVRRDGAALLRVIQSFERGGAPGLLRATARAQPGTAEVELTLTDARGEARRTIARVELAEAVAARVQAAVAQAAPRPGDRPVP